MKGKKTNYLWGVLPVFTLLFFVSCMGLFVNRGEARVGQVCASSSLTPEQALSTRSAFCNTSVDAMGNTTSVRTDPCLVEYCVIDPSTTASPRNYRCSQMNPITGTTQSDFENPANPACVSSCTNLFRLGDPRAQCDGVNNASCSVGQHCNVANCLCETDAAITPERCGNGTVQTGEQCDGTDLTQCPERQGFAANACSRSCQCEYIQIETQQNQLNGNYIRGAGSCSLVKGSKGYFALFLIAIPLVYFTKRRKIS